MIIYNPIKLDKDEQFWLYNPNELYKSRKWMKVLPTKGMTNIEVYNSLTRLALYFSILILVVNDSTELLCFPVVLVAALIIMFHLNKNKRPIINTRTAKKGGPKQVLAVAADSDDDDINNIDDIGSLDSQNTLGSLSSNNSTHNQVCRGPTGDNPYMNPALSDYNIPDPPAACNADDEEINDNIAVNFNSDLFRNTSDLWDKENSQRQFYTVPNTAVPNNQVEFAKWLYLDGPTCKEDTTQCFRQTELRRNNRQLNPY